MVLPKPPIPILNTADALLTGLVAAHPLVDGIGTSISDLSGNGYTGTASGGFTWFNDPELGVVLQLDGTSAFITLDATINTVMNAQSTATVAFWLKLTNATPGASAQAGLVTIQTFSGAGSATLYPDTDGLGYFSTFRQISRFDGVALGATDRSTWHHLAITTASSGTYRVYINGVEVGNTSGEIGISATVAPPTLGRSTDGTSDYHLDGYLGDFRVWGRELLAPEILTLFNDPWRMYTPEDLKETEFKSIGGSIDFRPEPAVASRALLKTADLRIQPDTSGNSLLSMVDLDPRGDIGATFLAAQVDVSPTPQTSFPALADERDPKRKPDTPVKFANPFDTDRVLAIPFAEGTGTTATDYAGSTNGPHNATLVTSATWADGGFPANDYTQAPGLDPSSDYAEVTRDVEHEPSTNITLAAWVFPTSASQASRGIISKLGTAGNSFYLGTATTTWRFQIQDNIDGLRTVDSVATIQANTLTHLAATYDGILMRIYVNGVESNSIANGGTIVYDVSRNIRIGQAEGGSSFVGVVDDVQMWNNRILDADEVLELYTSQFGMYCDQALFNTVIGSVDLRAEPDTASRALLTTVDLRLQADTVANSHLLTADLAPMGDVGATFLGAQIDIVPPVSNLSGLIVYKIDPQTGNTNGGDLVTIRGNNLQDITDVQLGGVSLTGISNPNSSTITGTTGAHIPGTVDLVVFSASLGNVTLLDAFTYVPFFGPGSDLLIRGAQLDPGIIRTEFFTGETAPAAADTVLSFTLADYPVDVTAVELFVRRIGENGGTLQRQGSIYQYTVDMAARQITWRSTASFALIATDEIIVRYVAQGTV